MIEVSKAREIVELSETVDRLRKYKYIMGAVYSTEVAADYTFQEAYCDFYPMRKYYSEEFLNRFFALMEEIKDSNSTEFRDAFVPLNEIGSVELMTAASLLIHSVTPRLPVWDKLVAKQFFDLDEPVGEEVEVEKCCKRYEEFQDLFYAYMNSPEGDSLVRVFDEKFPNAEISDVVKLDLIMWKYLQEEIEK